MEGGGGRGEWRGEGQKRAQQEPWGGRHLAGDEVLAHRQGHLDGVGLVGDRGGVELDLPGAVPLVGLVHSLAEHLLVLPRAQHRADIDDLGVAGGTGEGAGEEQGECQQAHGAHGLGAAPWLWAAQMRSPWRIPSGVPRPSCARPIPRAGGATSSPGARVPGRLREGRGPTGSAGRGFPGACVPALALALPLSAVLKRFPALPWAPGAERTPGGGSSRASLVRFPTLRRLRQLRSRERGQRLLPLPPPPLPNTEPKGGRLPRLSVRLRSCEHSSGCAGAGSACVRVCVRVQVCACARVSVCVGVAGTVTWLSRSCRELSPCHCVQPCISFNMTERVPVCVCVHAHAQVLTHSQLYFRA